MARGKRYAEKQARFSIKKKMIAIVLIMVLITMLIVEASLSFFSDVIIVATNVIIGRVDISISNVLIEERDVIDRPSEDGVFGEEVPMWTVGDINSFQWTVTNHRSKCYEIIEHTQNSMGYG